MSYPRRVLRQAWRDTLSIYYANTPIWRWFKSAGLLVFGFFCWSAAGLLLSYRPDWGFLTYVMAYGFVLILWGPLTHFVIVPLAIRLRRTAEHPVTRAFSRHVSKINLTVFFTIVLILGTAPLSPMILDFQSPFQSDGTPDVSTDLVCTQSDEVVTCHLSNPSGVDHLVVTSGGTQIATIDDPASEFSVPIDDLEAVVGQKQLRVELRGPDGERLRVFQQSIR